MGVAYAHCVDACIHQVDASLHHVRINPALNGSSAPRCFEHGNTHLRCAMTLICTLGLGSYVITCK